jgi:hypothetical protein
MLELRWRLNGQLMQLGLRKKESACDEGVLPKGRCEERF